MKNRIIKNQTPSSEALAIFFESIAMYLKAGISLEYAPEMICRNYKSGTLYEIAKAITFELPPKNEISLITNKESFSKALNQTGLFPVYAVKSIQLAELSGRVEETIMDLGMYYRKEKAFIEKMRQTLFSIATITSIMAVALFISAWWIIPIYEKILYKMVMYADVDNMITLLRSGKLLIITLSLIFTVSSIFSGLVLFEKEKQSEKLLFFCPITKSIFQNEAMAKVAKSLSLLLKNGMMQKNAFHYATVLSGTYGKEDKYEECAKKLEQGDALGKSLVETGIFTGIESQALIHAEQNGQMDVKLSKIAEQYKEAAVTTAEYAMAIFEPLMALVLIFSVGVVLAAILIPLMQIIGGIA